MSISKVFKITLISLLFSLLNTSLFAVEEYVSKVYKEIDAAFDNKSKSELSSVLLSNVDDKYYYLMENYAKKKVRRLVIDNDYAFAMDAIYIIIDINIDSDYEDDDAVEMYSTIAEAYEVQEQRKIEAEKKAQAELARKAQEQEKIKTSLAKEYKVAETADGQLIYLSLDQKMNSYRWTGGVGFAPGLLVMSNLNPSPKVTDPVDGFGFFDFGINFFGGYEYFFDTIVLGGDAYIDGRLTGIGLWPDTFSGSAKKYETVLENPSINFDLFSKIAFKKVSENIFLKLGVTRFVVMEQGETTQELSTTDGMKYQCVVDSRTKLIGPAVGFQFENIKLGGSNWTIGANYNLMSFAKGYQLIGINTDCAIPFAALEKLKMCFHFGLNDKLAIGNGGIENRAVLIVGFGAENVFR